MNELYHFIIKFAPWVCVILLDNGDNSVLPYWFRPFWICHNIILPFSPINMAALIRLSAIRGINNQRRRHIWSSSQYARWNVIVQVGPRRRKQLRCWLVHLAHLGEKFWILSNRFKQAIQRKRGSSRQVNPRRKVSVPTCTCWHPTVPQFHWDTVIF